MSERISPNPHSPYADADPAFRHVFPVMPLFGSPTPGALGITACEAMAVVPLEPMADTADGRPEGLCPACLVVVDGGPPPEREVGRCEECDSSTRHGRWCALCRQDLHEEWWPTRDHSKTDKGADR